MTAVLLNQDRSPMITYKVTPYFTNSRLADLFDVQSMAMEASVLENIDLSQGDQVHGIWDATIKFGQWSDLLLVMRVQDVEKRKQLQQMLQKSCANAPPIVLGENSTRKMEQLRGRVVACKSSKDGIYYRAVITGTKQDKARLNFVDFGNIEGNSYKITRL